jgi:hypothetical protein
MLTNVPRDADKMLTNVPMIEPTANPKNRERKLIRYAEQQAATSQPPPTDSPVGQLESSWGTAG